MVIGYAFHGVLFVCKITKYFCGLQVFPQNIPLKSVNLTLQYSRKTKQVLRLANNTINANYQSDGHGLPVRSLRNQSSLPTEKQRAWVSLSASFLSVFCYVHNDV